MSQQADPIQGGIAPGEDTEVGRSETTAEDLEAYFESQETPRSEAPSTEGEGEGGEPEGGDGATSPEGSPPDPDAEPQGEEDGGAPAEEEPQFEIPEVLTINGQTVTREALENIVGFQQWLAQNPQQLAAIDAYVRGEAELTPRQQQQLQQQQQQQGEDEPEFDDPRAAEEIARLNDQVGQLTQAQQVEAQQRLVASLETGQQTFGQKYELEPAEVEKLTQAVAQSQILPAFAARFPGDPATAMAEALDYQYWNTPSYREAELAKMVDTKVQETLQADAESAKRKAKAGSLSGSSGSVPRVDVPKTPQDKQKAMVAELKQAMDENRPT